MRYSHVVAVVLMLSTASVEAAAQSTTPRKDIPAIAKAANTAIVTIVMANNDEPIARGTGFLVRADGAILTNYHVIATGNVGVVKFADGTILPVDGVLATDKFRDLAIIKIHGKTFPTLTLGNSNQIQVGEEVVAIGNPLGLELTVSNGILSGIRSDENKDGKLLQITAPISRGSSGGPLFNMFGEVVGINAMFLEGGESLNFAIPVNDAKNLLVNRSAQLQQLPNEAEADPRVPDPLRPDASTGSPSDAASPKEKESAIRPSFNTGKEKQLPSYYVRSYQRGSFIIEYDGRQMVAACREALGWSHGAKLGLPMTTHDCVYLPGFVRDFGKHIPAEQMWRGDMELRFEPFGHDKVDVADVLDIIAESPIGSPLRKPSFMTSPEIVKTLHWIQNTLDDRKGTTQYPVADGRIVDHINLMPESNGCQVTFVYEELEGRTADFHSREQVNLGDLDPASIESHDSIPEIGGLPVSAVRVQTTDDKQSVDSIAGDWGWETSYRFPTTYIIWELPSPYAERFVKALKHAITLCGGKTSTF